MSTDRPRRSSRRELGGLAGGRGYWYQYLFGIRVLASVLDGTYDSFSPEESEDIVAIKRNSDQSVARYTAFQIKSSASPCLLRDSRRVGKIWRSFAGTLARHSQTDPIELVLVYNRTAGHDCSLLGCRAVALSNPAFASLATSLAAKAAIVPAAVDILPFLPLTPSIPDLIELVRPIERFSGGAHAKLMELLEREEAVPIVVHALTSMLTPFFGASPGRVGRTNEQAVNNALTMPDLLARLRSSLSIAFERARRLEATGSPKPLDACRATAVIQVDEARQASTVSGLAVHLGSRSQAVRAATAICATASEPTSLWPLTETEIRQTPDSYWLSYNAPATVSATQYLSDQRRTHHGRVSSMRAAISALTALVRCGVRLDGFRPDHEEYGEHYRLGWRQQQPVWLLADVSALHAIDSATDLLPHSFVLGSVVADLIRGSYGTKALRSRRRQLWDDDLVASLAELVSRVPYLPASDAADLVASAVGDELDAWPVIFDGMEDSFVRDIVAAGIDDVADALAPLRITHVGATNTRTRGWRYFISSTAVLTARLVGGSLTLTHYLPYGRFRWISARRRDQALGIRLEVPRDRSMVSPVLVWSANQRAAILREVLDIAERDYDTWLHATIIAAEHWPVEPMPDDLETEYRTMVARRERINRLKSSMLLDVVTSRADRLSSSETFRTHEALNVAALLDELGYAGDRRDGLRLVIDSEEKVQAWPFVRTTSDDQGQSTIVVSSAAPLPYGSRVIGHLADAGEDAVLTAEEAFVAEFLFARRTQDQTAAGQTWAVLDELLAGTTVDSVPGNDAGREVPFELPRALEGDAVTHDVLDGIASDRAARRAIGVYVVRGGPGTGKTREMAAILAEFVQRFGSSRLIPPVRALMVGPSHFSVDRFCEALFKIDPTIVPYRFETEATARDTRRRSTADEAIRERSRAHYADAVRHVPVEAALAESRFERQRRALRERLTAHTQRIVLADDATPPPTLAGHAAFRIRHGLPPLPSGRTLHDLIERQLVGEIDDLSRMADGTPNTAKAHGRIDHDAQFSASVIATTADALDRMPDLNYDLFVMDEGSQLRLLTAAKALWKVVRARNEAEPLTVIAGGDAHQLGPFSFERFLLPGEDSSRQGRASDRAATFFARATRSRTARVLTLTTQRRMHSQIAGLVRWMFYPTERWRTLVNDDGDGVVWIDAPFGQNARPRPDKSMYNEPEATVACRVLDTIVGRVPSIAVLSPYRAQVEVIHDRLGILPAHLKVGTIDAHQGAQAHSAIISFVHFGVQGFALDPGRLCVALSRGSGSLYLVGDLQKLITRAATATAPPFLRRLAEAFRPGGFLAPRVRRNPS